MAGWTCRDKELQIWDGTLQATNLHGKTGRIYEKLSVGGIAIGDYELWVQASTGNTDFAVAASDGKLWSFSTLTGTGNFVFYDGVHNCITFEPGGTNYIYIKSNGNIGIYGNTSPTARFHLPAGAAAANSAPLKFTSGINLTTPVAGAMEYDGTDLFFTEGTPTRQYIAKSAGKGLSVTIITAALTAGGTQGSMTFVNGVLTAQTPAT